jgi:hypothetical protein
VTEPEPGAGSPGLSGPSARQVATGDRRVDEAVARLADLAEMPVADHPAIFEHIHQQLSQALGDLDAQDRVVTRDRAAPEHGPGLPGL